jgi:CDP-glycerol glycerophosphotransferase (TagB/SpsB family)
MMPAYLSEKELDRELKRNKKVSKSIEEIREEIEQHIYIYTHIYIFLYTKRKKFKNQKHRTRSSKKNLHSNEIEYCCYCYSSNIEKHEK